MSLSIRAFFQGMAPGARLVLIDHTYGQGGIMSPPGNSTFAFEWAYLVGAKVHSASWGSSCAYCFGGFPAVLFSKSST